MAGDWVKIEHTLPDKPEVDAMAKRLSLDHDSVVGKCVRWFVWLDQQSRNGHAISVTESFIDRLSYCPGFAAALREVGWLNGREGHLSIPNFDRHNGQTAKNRALSKDRQAKSRSESVTKMSRSHRDKSATREEKRREDVSSIEETKARDGPVSNFDGAHFLFDSWWKVYPRHSGKKAAFESWKLAILGIRQQRQLADDATAAEWLLVVTGEFAASPKGKSEFVPAPAKWLDEGRWDDDRSEWQRDSGTANAQRGSRQRAPNPGSEAGSEDEWAERFEASRRASETGQGVAGVGSAG